MALAALPARAEDQAAPASQSSPAFTAPGPSAAPTNEPTPAAEAVPTQAEPNPVVQIIRAKLADPSVGKGADAYDLTALQAFYAARTGAPVWTTEMG
ncbi:MAG TPA: hypothetical protein VGY14_03645, partial [Methyloceanibacter sp.]|nr:hypothetical protein [Methyloceanibacter sp.]